MYEIIRSRRRTISIEVRQDASLVVRAPNRASLKEIEEFVASKSSWVEKTQAAMRQRFVESPEKSFQNGEDFLYLGSPYKLSVSHGGKRALEFNEGFILSPDHTARAREFFTNWYKDAAAKLIRERADLLLASSGRQHSGIKITGAKRRWGSCARSGRLTFSWRLAMAPLEVVDYVVAHEIAHLDEMNHSSRFWAKVESIFPGYREQRKWLRDHGHKLTF
jgi:predicted metal-dependent hydrolase